ncbi:hypothetical protein GDO81_007778 [Engystomops pustulosus]|uniref:Peptidase M10 metallopeptidase domain-containing protein n=1 Tax=Engystomops pustulosus TaxID=76066 RepID=A0AAV7CBA9_ENGPU|nr:hypothetical protein GDO81_007778 [Engystomops pustulosus]
MGLMVTDGILSIMSMYVITGASLLLLSFGIWYQQESVYDLVKGDRQACGVNFPSRSGRWKRYTINPLGYKWDHLNLTYRIVQYPNTLNKGDTDKALEIAFSMWSKVSPLTFQRVFPKLKSDLSIGFTPLITRDCWNPPIAHLLWSGLNGTSSMLFYHQDG